MANIKNTFQGSKMNQDLDDRLIPNGTYRSGTNIQVSNSESDDVGTLQTVLGNFELSDFGVPTTVTNLEIIGQAVDQANDMIIVFATNAAATTILEEDRTGTITLPDGTQLASQTKSAASCFICCHSPNFTGIIVQGSFLKFSKLFPITANILEDLLFFTDNFNQPRKINIKAAISDNTYYTNEDQISVAKYYPYEAASFITSPTGYKKLGLINKQDKYLPPSFAADGIIHTSSSPHLLILKNGISGDQVNLFAHMQPTGVHNTNISLTGQSVVAGTNKRIKVTNLSVPGATEAFVRNIFIDSQTPPNCEIKLELETGTDITSITASLPQWSTGHRYGFSFPNPDYDASFAYSGQSTYLEDKFVRFSYRFRFDDGEYSLMAPFTQAAFIPKQHGYFVGRDAEITGRKGIVDFMENSVTNVTLNIPLPSSSADTLITQFKVDEVQIVSKAAGDQNIKVVAELDTESYAGLVSAGAFSGTGTTGGFGYSPGTRESDTQGGSGTGLRVRVKRTGTLADDYGPLDTNFLEIIDPGKGYKIGDLIHISAPFQDPTTENHTTAKFLITSLRSYIEYNYNSQQPIKVLPEKEITRVSDMVPIKALAQTIVGSRVVYGNFLQKHGNVEKLDYDIEISDKKVLSSADQEIKAHPNHTVKQGRTYQVGIILRDRYGRTSNVILNDDLDDKSSTIYVPYTAGGSDPLEFFGRSLKLKWNREIPNTIKNKDWPGLYQTKINETGWYSYQVVVKQKEQDYYNVYTAGSLSGEIIFKGLGDHSNLTYSNTGGNSHIALSGDNINKVPRELKEIGSTDQNFGSTTDLFCVVAEPEIPTGNTNVSASAAKPKVSQQMLDPKRIEVEEIKTFRNLGDWTMYKGVDLNHLDLNGGQYSAETFIYPGVNGQTDPIFLGGNKNPYVAKIATRTRLGFDGTTQRPGNTVEPDFAKNLHVFETAPVESALEIFYETSTSGLISSLNASIRNAEPSGVLTGLSPIVFSLQEGDAVGTNCTNAFEVMKGATANQKIANPLSAVSLVRVVDGDGNNVTNKFEVVKLTSGSSGTSPTFAIRNTVRFVFKNGSFDGDCVFDFTLKATCPDSEGTNVSKTFSFSNFRVTNKKPILYAGQARGSIGALLNHLTGNNPGSTRVISADLLTSFPVSSQTGSYIDVAQTGTGVNHTMKAQYIDRANLNNHYRSTSTGFIAISLMDLTFITNGFAAITSFTSSTALGRSSGISATNNRILGLKPVILSVRRMKCHFVLTGSNAGKYYFPGNRDEQDKTHEFFLRPLFKGGMGYDLAWMPQNETHIKRSDLGDDDGNNSDSKAGWLFETVIQLKDCSDGADGNGAGFKTADNFIHHFIIHR
mgnify:CR=1 FL=1